MVLPANSTCAIGTPVARLFFEPQKRMVMRSSWLKPNALPSTVEATNTSARTMQQTSTSPSRSNNGICCQRPSITASLNAP
ncbi:hypothetical protein D3C86_2026130 [compost metagenome]